MDETSFPVLLDKGNAAIGNEIERGSVLVTASVRF